MFNNVLKVFPLFFLLSSEKRDTNILSFISNVTLSQQIHDKHTIFDMFCSLRTSHHFSRFHLQCDIGMGNPCSQNQLMIVFCCCCIYMRKSTQKIVCHMVAIKDIRRYNIMANNCLTPSCPEKFVFEDHSH